MTDTPTNLPALVAGNTPRPIVPTSLAAVMDFADVVLRSQLAPLDMNTKEKITVAVLHGLEIGLPPLQALQKIAVINGRPALWGDGAMALVRASGVCEWVEESMAGDGETMVATCRVQRKGEKKPVERQFSVADAKRARLWDTREKVKRRNHKTQEIYEAPNDSPWFRFPKRMLQMRARALALRDVFADVLGGLYLAEELQEADPADALDAPAPAPAAKRGAKALPPAVDAAPAAEIVVEAADVVAVDRGSDNGADEPQPEPPPKTTGKPLPPRAQMNQSPPPVLDPETSAVLSERLYPPTGNTKAEPESPAPAAPQADPLDIPASLDRRPKKGKDADNPLALPSFEDGEAVLTALHRGLKSFGDAQGEQAATWWNDAVLPRLDELLPPDQEAALGIWREHEKRFGG